MKIPREQNISDVYVVNWIPIHQYSEDNPFVLRWHKIWKCPIAVKYRPDYDNELTWMEQTLTHVWPDAAFYPFFLPIDTITAPGLQNYQTQGREKPVECDKKSVPMWYDVISLMGYLQGKGFHNNIVNEIASDYADNLQQAFAKGWEKAYNDYKKSGTMDYVYYPKQLAEINQLNASQPNPAIAVIEALKDERQERLLKRHNNQSLIELNLLETILKQIKP